MGVQPPVPGSVSWQARTAVGEGPLDPLIHLLGGGRRAAAEGLRLRSTDRQRERTSACMHCTERVSGGTLRAHLHATIRARRDQNDGGRCALHEECILAAANEGAVALDETKILVYVDAP